MDSMDNTGNAGAVSHDGPDEPDLDMDGERQSHHDRLEAFRAELVTRNSSIQWEMSELIDILEIMMGSKAASEPVAPVVLVESTDAATHTTAE